MRIRLLDLHPQIIKGVGVKHIVDSTRSFNLEEVWRIYDDNGVLVSEFDTSYDFHKAWERVVANFRCGWTWKKEPRWERVPAPVRGSELPLKRFL